MFELTKVKKKNICIMGLMGSGKSIIGKELSRYLNLNFYDTDREIELKTKKNIDTIFEEEIYFISLMGSHKGWEVIEPVSKTSSL